MPKKTSSERETENHKMVQKILGPSKICYIKNKVAGKNSALGNRLVFLF